MKNLPINSDKKFKYSITFQSWDEESLEVGQTNNQGFIEKDEVDTIGEILHKANSDYGIYMPVSFGTWESTEPIEDKDYFEKGIKTYFGLHLKNEDGTEISEEENDFITFLLSDGRLEIDKFREYAVGGLVAGAIAIGIGGLIAYYYFKGKKKASNKNNAKEVEHNDIKYPIKDAWRREHKLHNKEEDYEVPKRKRKRVSYAEGGLLQGITSRQYFLVVKNWVYFTFNFPSKFVTEMPEFHQDKWGVLYSKYGALSVAPSFWKSVSKDIQLYISNWIRNNYVNSQSEKEELNAISEKDYFDIIFHWNLFCQNPPMNFIEGVFGNEGEHFEHKWVRSYERAGAIGSMNKFFTELSVDNQEKLTNWVYKNFKPMNFAGGGLLSQEELEKNAEIYFSENYNLSKSELLKDLEKYTQMKEDLNEKRITPRQVVGTGYVNARKVANEWINGRIQMTSYLINHFDEKNRLTEQQREQGQFAGGGSLDLSMREKAEMYSYLDDNNWTLESFMARFNKDEEEADDIIMSWAKSRGYDKKSKGGDTTLNKNIMKKTKGSYAGGGSTDLEYSDILNVLQSKIEDSIDEIPNEYENSDTYTGEEIEHEYRDGFIPYTDGGYQAHWFEFISQMFGAGYTLPTKQLEDEMQRQIKYSFDSAKENFIEKYPEIVEELGEENIDYHSLYEAGYGEEAEELSSDEMDMMSEDTILMRIFANYYNPDNSRAKDGKHTIRLFGDVNLESPYHRTGNLDDSYEYEFTFDSIAELESEMDKGLEKVISWFKGDMYNDSTTEMKVRRMADGGRVTTNEDVLKSFLTSTKEVKANNLSTHFNQSENTLLLRNYGTIIAGRKTTDDEYATIKYCYTTKTKYSVTTTKILNQLKALAVKMGYTISDACSFANGGMAGLKEGVYNVNRYTLTLKKESGDNWKVTIYDNVKKATKIDKILPQQLAFLESLKIGKVFAGGGEAGNPFDDEDIAVYMCETQFGDDWFDGEDYRDENVEAYYQAVHQYIKYLQGNLKLAKNETPLYEGNLDNEDKKFIKDSLKESRYVSKNNLFAGGGEAGSSKFYAVSFWLKDGLDAQNWIKENGLTNYEVEIDEGDEEINGNGYRVNVFDLGKGKYNTLSDLDSVVDIMIEDEEEYAGGGYINKHQKEAIDIFIKKDLGINNPKDYTQKQLSDMVIKGYNSNEIEIGGSKIGEDFEKEIKQYISEKYAGGGKVKGIKKKAEKLLEQSINYRWVSTDMGSGWSFELESPLDRSVFNVIEQHTYLDEFSPEDAGFEDWDNESKEQQEYYYEEWKEEFFQGAFENFKEKCMKHLDDFVEYIQQAKEYQDEMNEYAEGGELKVGSVVIGKAGSRIPAKEVGEIIEINGEKAIVNWRYGLGENKTHKISELMYAGNNEYAEGGEVEDWMEEALESLIEETGFDELEITMVSDNGNEFYCTDGDTEYRVFKTEDDAEEKAIEQVREDMEESPENFNQDFIKDYIDGREYFEDALNEMNYSYAYDIQSEKDDKYESRLIAEMVEWGILDDVDAHSSNAEEIANDNIDDFVTLLTNEQLGQGNNGLDYFISNFGEEETMKMVIDNNLIDIDEASKDAVQTDGIGHFLSYYDGETLYLKDDCVAYRVN